MRTWRDRSRDNLAPSAPSIHRPPPKSTGLVLLASLFAFFGAALVGYVALEKVMEAQVMLVLNHVSSRVDGKVEFRYRNVRVSIWERAVRINGISIRPTGVKETLRIDRVSVSEIDWETILKLSQTGGAPTIPKTIRLGFQGLHLTPRMLGAKPSAMLKDLGYEEISLSMSSGFLFDRKNHVFGIRNMNVELKDMGRLSFSVELGNVPMPTDAELLAISQNPEAKPAPPDVTELSLRSAELRYDDLSLIGRLDQFLKNEGQPGLADMVQMSARAPASTDPFLTDVASKLKEFVSTPQQSLRLSTRPAQPLPFSTIGLEALLGPEKLAKKLNLTLEVR